jgi:hypothetical protein
MDIYKRRVESEVARKEHLGCHAAGGRQKAYFGLNINEIDLIVFIFYLIQHEVILVS